LIAQQTNLEVGDFVWTGGDCHIYTNHIEQVKEQLSRKPYPYPQIKVNRKDSIFDYDYSDFELIGYEFHPFIKAPIAV
jgi:thymidylate synthase